MVVTGTLVSNSSVDVKAETTGRLLQFAKQEGDAVSAGEVVATVDDENYKIAVRQAQAAVQVADAALARTRVLAAHAKSELARSQNLVRSGGITEKDLEAAQLADRDAQAQVAVAEAQLAQARAAQEWRRNVCATPRFARPSRASSSASTSTRARTSSPRRWCSPSSTTGSSNWRAPFQQLCWAKSAPASGSRSR